MILKQSTAVILKVGPFVDDTDFKTAETGLTIAQADIQISKNGGTFAQTSDAAPTTTHDTDGFYPIPLTTTDTATLGTLSVQVTVSGALQVWKDCHIVTANVYDTLFSTDKLEVDLLQMVGVAQSATDLKDFADAGYDPGTNKVQGVVLVDTATTVTGGATEAKQNTAQTDLDTITGVNGVNLTDNAITAGKYDETTAFPLTAVNGSTLTEAGGTGDHLTAINLPNQTMDITGNITGNLTGSVGSVTGAVGSVAGNVDGDVSGDITSLTAAAIDSILDEVVEGTITLRQSHKMVLAVLTGKTSGGGGNPLVFRDIADSKNRLSVTADANGNRTAVGTRDAT